MNFLTYTKAAVGAALLAVSMSVAMADPIDVIKVDTLDLGDLPNFGDATVATAITNAINDWNGIPKAPTLPLYDFSTPSPKVTPASGPTSFTVNLDPYSYIFLHWGQGQTAEYAQLFYVNDPNGETNFQFNAPGQNGLSFYSIYGGGQSVPDGGTTALLVGLALLATGVIARRVRRLT